MFSALRLAFRQFAKSRGFAIVIVVTLALGIGAATTIFSAINALLLRSLPVKSPEQLVTVVMPMPFIREGGAEPARWRLYDRFRKQSSSFSDLFATAGASRRPLVAGGGMPDFVKIDHVTGNFFTALGVKATVGRTLLPADDERGAPQAVAVISHAFWQRRFGTDPGIVGQTVRVDNIPVTIVGVAAPRFFGVSLETNVDVWCPIHAQRLLDPERGAPDEDDWMGLVLGRLRPGVARAKAQAELNAIFQQDLARKSEGRNLTNLATRQYFIGRTLELQPAGTGRSLGGLQSQLRHPLTLLIVAVGVLLLVACANVAGLLLARGAAREREFAVRAALGAGRMRLMRQLLVESLLLAFSGGVLGVFFAQWGMAFLVRYLPEDTALELALDLRVLVVALVVTTACGIVCGLVPALRFSRVDLNAGLKTSPGMIAGGFGETGNGLLVIGQIALSFVLLATAGLFGRTLQNLRTLDAGFAREDIMLFTVDPGKTYPGTRGAELYKRLLARLETLPGVRAVTMSTGELALGDGASARISIPGYMPGPNEIPLAHMLDVGPRFLASMGIPLLRGRDITAQDLADNAPQVAIINEAMAHRYFAGTDPIGKRFRWGRRQIEIVGLAKNVISYEHVREKPRSEFYAPFVPDDPNEVRAMTFNLRIVGNPLALAGTFREAVRQLAPDARVLRLSTMAGAVDQALLNERAVAQLSGLFSVFAVALSGLGLYGLLSYGFVRRTREFGVRIAIGAQWRDIISLVLLQGLKLAIVGCALGLGGAMVATRFISSLLYDVDRFDPTTLVATSGVMLIVAFLACWWPARRAARVDPMIALRAE